MEQVSYQIIISQDIDCESPREWDNLGQLLADVRGHNIGDGSLRAFLNATDYDGDDGNITEIVAYLNKSGYAVPISMTEHSGRSFYRGAPCEPWDSGYIGVYYVSDTDGLTVEQMNGRIDDELNEYEQWANGECYCYRVNKITDDGNGWTKTDEIESMCGFLGYENCLKSAQQAVPDGADVKVID